MPPGQPRIFWRNFRSHFKWFRVSVLLLLLTAVLGLFYLNQAGLPEFLRGPLLAQLQSRGIRFEYSRLRVRIFNGIVAENVRFGGNREPNAPELTARRVELPLNHAALLRLEIVPEGLEIQDGRLTWEVPEIDSNQPGRKIVVENIWTRLNFAHAEHWELENFNAEFKGGSFKISGVITNGSALRRWFAAKTRKDRKTIDPAGARLRFWADMLESIEFSQPPILDLRVRGDALDPRNFYVDFLVRAPGARTPWVNVTGGLLSARVLPENSDGIGAARIRLRAASAQTRWAVATNVSLDIDLSSQYPATNVVAGALRLSAASAQTRWASAANIRAESQWNHSLTNPVPLNGSVNVRCVRLSTPWGEAGAARIASDFRLARQAAEPDPALGFWNSLLPYELDWSVSASQLVSTTNRFGEVTCNGSWSDRELLLAKLEGQFDHRPLSVVGSLNAVTRELKTHVSSRADPHDVPMLPPAALKWLSQFTWSNAPALEADARLVLPAWTNHEPDWHAVTPTIQLAGEFDLAGGGAYRGLAVDSAQGQFTYTNRVWHLPTLAATRPEGRLEAEHRANEATHDFYWKFVSTADPRIIEPLLDADERKVFQLLSLGPPPRLEGELWGRSQHPELTGFRGSVALTNFGFRGETASVVRASLHFTNKQLTVLEPRLERGSQRGRASGVLVDFDAQLVHLTNGYSTLEPLFAARCLGPHIVKILQPYQFEAPPTVQVGGTIPLHGEEQADLRFDIDGGRFSWWKFNLHTVQARLHWHGTNLDLSGLHSQFYGGEAEGWAKFVFVPGGTANFEFDCSVTNAFLQLLMADLTISTNQLEGLLSGRARVTHANTGDTESADGYGQLRLRDGLIWDIPLFGIFSTPLNTLSPGLGSSRVGWATCTFRMTNSVLYSDDFEMRAPALRLGYRGTVDLEGNLNARVEGAPLRDIWLVGPVVSTVLWPFAKLFEYKLTGSLNHPKTEPVHIVPKIIQLPFQPFRLLRGIFQEKVPDNGQNTSKDNDFRKEP